MKKKIFLMLVFPAIIVALMTPSADAAPEQDTIDALTALKNHILKNPALTGPQIAAYKAVIDSNESLFGTSQSVMTAGFELVDTYETQIAPLWSQGSSISQFDRTNLDMQDINWVVFVVMQDIIDYTYTVSNISAYESFLNGKLFKTSSHHPGAVDPPATITTHTATINGSYPDTLGWNRQGDDLPARKPTGTYVAPGTIVTVTVPNKLINKGYQVRVGCHSWDLEKQNRRWIRRMDRMSKVYDITSTTTKVASPLGGGIYIEVPYLANAGVVNIDITGAVRSPYYSYNTVTGHITTLSEWQNTERNHPAPWADFQTEKTHFNMPTDWVYNLDDPVTVMADWDTAVDTMNDLMGFPHDRGKETIYAQVDVIFRGTAYYPGYPTGNDTYNPNNNYGGLANHYMVKGPQYVYSAVFHEQGHAYFFDKFTRENERESVVNLPHVAVWNKSFGFDLDYAFAASRGLQGNPNKTLDNTAVTWMTCFNFSPNETDMTQAEKQYQLKGHAKFVDIAKLFGWSVLEDYYHQLVLENKNKNNSGLNDDDRVFRWCHAAGVDLRPLFHFWGIHPINFNQLKNNVIAENLAESNEVYDRLWYYRSIVPADNSAFQAFAQGWWGKQPSIGGNMTEREHARQWDNTDLSGGNPLLPNGEIYNENSHDRIVAYIDTILDLYFPNGDPDPDVTAPMPDPMTFAKAPAAPTGEGDPLNILTAETLNGKNPATGLPWKAGDTYRLVFVTSGTRSAKSNNIDNYNAFVQAAADASPLGLSGVSWKVIASTDTVDARDNTSTNTSVNGPGQAIFLVDGSTLVANNYTDLWDGSIDNLINMDENGTGGISANPATGSSSNGTKRDRHLGGSDENPPKIEYGDTNRLDGKWALIYSAPASNSFRYYALSDPITLGDLGDPETQITMTASQATDESGVEYYFECTAGDCNDSGWQDSPVYADLNLSPCTEYTYRVRARDKSQAGNLTGWSAEFTARTKGRGAGDTTGDCAVNNADFAVIAVNWLGYDPMADIYPQGSGDGKVDLLDLALLAENWLNGVSQ